MDINKLIFAELFKKEHRAVKVLIEALLEIHGHCKCPNGDIDDDMYDCDNCAFLIRQNCGRLFLDDWLNILEKRV
jgi:hypothetical protein